jgi:NAD+ kinase
MLSRNRKILIKKVGILYHPMVPATSSKAQELSQFLGSRDIAAWICSAWETEKCQINLDGTDLLVTFGGDGTILRASQIALRHQIPITGINMGNLGFLTEIKADEAIDGMSELLDGEVWIDQRTMLEAEVIAASAPKPFDKLHALNDIVIARGAMARLIHIKAKVDSVPLTNYRADGVILATATGSTGYSLSAGGPILYPQSADMLLVPIVPHLNLDYSLVLPASSVVELEVETTHQATISVDGHTNFALSSGDIVRIKRSNLKTMFLRIQDKNGFYKHLEEKLRGKR